MRQVVARVASVGCAE